MAYSISSLRKLGVSLPVRGVILLFFVFMPMFSNYAALLTKDVLFADAFLVLLVQTVKLVAGGLARRDANVERTGEKPPCSLRATTGCCLLWAPWAPRFCVTAAWCFPWRHA